jgi:hypothetical protein
MDLRLATLKTVSFYFMHNVSTLNQCRKLSCGTVVCKHFAIYQSYPNYRLYLIQVQLDVHYILYFFLSSTRFGCYLHPSSGAQLQPTAIGFVSVENRGFSIKWCGGLFCMDLCVLVFQNLVWYLCAGVCVCVCVCHWICFDIAWSWCVVSGQIVLCYICVLTVWYVIALEQVLVWDCFTL